MFLLCLHRVCQSRLRKQTARSTWGITRRVNRPRPLRLTAPKDRPPHLTQVSEPQPRPLRLPRPVPLGRRRSSWTLSATPTLHGQEWEGSTRIPRPVATATGPPLVRPTPHPLRLTSHGTGRSPQTEISRLRGTPQPRRNRQTHGGLKIPKRLGPPRLLRTSVLHGDLTMFIPP